MIVHLSAEAEYDLETIGDYIARDGPARAALSFVHELRSKFLGLLDRSGSRSCRVMKRPLCDGVVIIHILHGRAQNYSTILFPS